MPAPKVVVVEDDHAVRNSLKFALEVEGFSVRAHGSAGDLLTSPIPLTCACLVIDQNLPGMSGLELIARLRERRVRVPAILITTHPSSAVTERASQAGVLVVEKPLLGNVLVDKIRSACAQHGNNSPEGS